jgi:hypothetical protein
MHYVSFANLDNPWAHLMDLNSILFVIIYKNVRGPIDACISDIIINVHFGMLDYVFS